MRQFVVCLDLEGVLIPEIWIAFAERTGIDELRLTTRDIADYDALMTHRLRILDEHDLKLSDISEVIAGLSPLPGAVDFLSALRQRYQVIILSDTFAQFANPLMAQLSWPTLFCHQLKVADDQVVGYQLRLDDQKRKTVEALQQLNFAVLAAGDSHNDLTMLHQADAGVLFCPTTTLAKAHPELPVALDYRELTEEFERAITQIVQH